EVVDRGDASTHPPDAELLAGRHDRRRDLIVQFARPLQLEAEFARHPLPQRVEVVAGGRDRRDVHVRGREEPVGRVELVSTLIAFGPETWNTNQSSWSMRASYPPRSSWCRSQNPPRPCTTKSSSPNRVSTPSWMTLPSSFVWMACFERPTAKSRIELTVKSLSRRSASGPVMRCCQRNDQSPR